MTRRIRVSVVEEHEVFRRGLVASLGEQQEFALCDAAADETAPHGDGEVDVAVVSDAAIARRRFDCPVVVCTAESPVRRQLYPGNVVAGVLLRATMTEAQLHATVCAVAAGLRVNAEAYDAVEHTIDGRAVRVAELLARGYTTGEIACDLNYSERTVKKVINELETLLNARTRAQLVAHAIRDGLI